MINECSASDLQSALAGSLPPDREEWLYRHLEQCAACSTAIEQLAGGTVWCEEVSAMLTGDELDEEAPSREEWSEADFTVEHLDPSDEPNVLGRLGDYDVLEVIGRGGMGVVLKGFDRELNRYVAIKVLAPHLAQSPLAKKRFIREARAAAAVVHPNVMAIHRVHPSGRLPFLVMPLVVGESLAQRLVAQGRLELNETLRIAMQAAAALGAAHEQGLVHRDVKPANILLEKGVERALLTDFGLARAADDVSMTRWGIIAGTPQYMSPEQAKGEPLDGRSDLFSLGCVLYEMATGVSPFRADSTMATLRRLIDDPPRALAALNPELPPWFVGLVERLLEKDPGRRFTSAKEVSQLLEGCLAHVQQPGGVPLPNVLISLRRDQCITVPARRDDEYDLAGRRLYHNPKRQRGPLRTFLAYASGCYVRKPRTIGALIMLALLGISLFAVGVVATNPPDISGQWSGEGWGKVVLTQSASGEYDGTFSDAVTSQSGKMHVRWSRIERRYNGTWTEGDKRFGMLSIHLVKGEIRGAYSTDAKSYPNTPQQAEVLWTRIGPTASHAKSEAALPIPISTAVHVVDLLSRGEFDKTTDYFDETEKKSRSPEAMKKLWAQLAERGGKFTGRGQPRMEQIPSYDVVYVPGKWERIQLNFRFLFDEQGRIAELRVAGPGASEDSQPYNSSTPLSPPARELFPREGSTRPRGAFYSVTYPVGDLVLMPAAVVDVPAPPPSGPGSPIPPPPAPSAADGAATPPSGPGAVVQLPSDKADFDTLTELIFTTVAPDSWRQKGGKGTISRHVANLTISVFQTQEVHEDIVDFLEQLRRMHNIQVVLKTRFIELDAQYAGRLNLKGELAALDAHRTAELLKRFEDDRYTWQAPRMTLFDGQAARYSINHFHGTSPEHCQVQATVDENRTMVKLGLTTDGSSKERPTTVRVKDDETAVVDITFQTDRANNGKPPASGKKVVIMMITPQIVVQEEEEDRMGLPAPDATPAARSAAADTGEYFVDFMSHGEFDKAAAYFDEKNKKKTPAAVLKGCWNALAPAGGEFIGHGPSRAENGYVFVPTHWERENWEYRLTFDKKGRISDWCLVAAAWQPPETVSAAENILKNSGIENGGEKPDDWQQGAAIDGVTYSWCKSAAFEGKASLCIEKTAERYFPIAQWSQTVDRRGDRPALRVSAQVKAEKMTKAVLDVLFLDEKDNWVSHKWAAYIGGKTAGDPPANHDWKLYCGTVPIPKEAKKICIGLQVYGPGKVWFDDVRAEYADKEERTDVPAPAKKSAGDAKAVMYFEDPDDMARQQKWLSEEMDRRAKQESATPSRGKDTVPDGSSRGRPMPRARSKPAVTPPSGTSRISTD